jgi:hypothetical protein
MNRAAIKFYLICTAVNVAILVAVRKWWPQALDPMAVGGCVLLMLLIAYSRWRPARK